jgi:ATP-dependent exoDNAse (exonuclease V) alpha subunit
MMEELSTLFGEALLKFKPRRPEPAARRECDWDAVCKATDSVEKGFEHKGRIIVLNKKQLFAVRIVAAHVLFPDSFDDQLIINIPGEAGCGKTIVAVAIQHWLRHHTTGAPPIFKVLAPTGAAARIAGGQTIHSALHSGKTSSSVRLHISGQRAHKLRSEFGVTQVLLVDETSMISAQLLIMLDRCLRVAKQCNLPYGGLHVIFFGDHYQLPPVAAPRNLMPYGGEPPSDDALVAALNLLEKDQKSAKAKEALQEQVNQHGAFLWAITQNACVIMDVCMRVAQDERAFVDFLKRLRRGNTGLSDEKTLLEQQRLVDGFDPDVWLYAPLLTPINEVAETLGILRLEELARHTRQQIVQWDADDKNGGKQVPVNRDIGVDKCNAPATGYFFAGLPVMITYNIKKTSIVNGMLAFAVALVLDDNEPERDFDATQCFRKLKHVPKGMIVCTSRHFDRNLPLSKLLEKDDIYFVPKSILSPNQNQKLPKNFSRRQIPIVPSLAITIHKSQGMVNCFKIIIIRTLKIIK